jgi:surface protein
MKPKIIAINKGHLEQLIDKEIADNGCYCDLNHIDVSSVTNMRGLFYCSNFKGNISEWDVSNVEEMSYMFSNAEFNGDISKWDVSKVVDMDGMFHNSHFNGDINNWKPYSLGEVSVFSTENKIKVYWLEYGNKESRNKAIDSYWLEKELQVELKNTKVDNKKIKI